MPVQQVWNLMQSSDTARLNLLTNGGFEIWQRGNGPFSASGTYSADRWYLQPTGGDTMTVTRETTTVDSAFGSKTSAKVVFTYSAGGGLSYLLQKFSAASEISGTVNRTVTLALRVWTATPNAVRIGLNPSAAATAWSSYHPGNSSWQTISVTGPVDAGLIDGFVLIGFSASCTAYVDNATLVVGNVPADYAPLHPADDLARCQRYYEILGGGYGFPLVGGSYQIGGAPIYTGLSLKQTKAVSPTFTKNGAWYVSNCAQPTVAGGNPTGFFMGITVTATGHAFSHVNAATDFVTAEANP